MSIRCLSFAMMALAVETVVAGTQTVSVFLDPTLLTITETVGWDVVTLEGGELRGIPGTPLLPAVPVLLLLPPGAEDVSFEVALSGEVPVGMRRLDIVPGYAQLPLMTDAALHEVPEPDPAIYRSDAPWPSEPVLQTHSGSLSGFTVASCLVQPWRYSPSRGLLSLYTDLEVTVSWSQGPAPTLTETQIEMASLRAAALQPAAGAVSSASPASIGSRGESEYLIICDSAYTGIFQPLAELHQSQGMTVEIATVQDILSAFPGRDGAEQLRNFIRDRFLNSGTVYVLLGGDEELVPVRMIYLLCEGYADTAPVDLYFADLDGDWDGSGDGEFGQPDDDLDLYADVLLGRALVGNQEEAVLFVQKNLVYQSAPPAGDWSSRALLCGAVLFEDQGYTSAKGCDSIAAAMPASWDITKAYEVLYGDGFDTHIAVLDSGTGWNHFAGHGSNKGIWWAYNPRSMMTKFLADTLTNGDMAGIHTSIACHPAAYIDYECCAEAILHNPDGGGVAVMFNTSYGWEGFWPELGASEWMCIDLARSVFRNHARSIGFAFSTARDLRVPYVHFNYDRTFQSLLSFSAFMDPALAVLDVPSVGPIPPVRFSISAPSPNPATRAAPISFFVDFSGNGSTEVSVHDMAGRLLWHTDLSEAGRVSWDGADGAGGRVPAGVYIITARRGDYIASRLATVLN